MPRKPRLISQAGTYHFINRGINKKTLFHKPVDFEYYLSLIGEYSKALGVKIHHYCLMTNHTHLLVGTEDMAALSVKSAPIRQPFPIQFVNPFRSKSSALSD